MYFGFVVRFFKDSNLVIYSNILRNKFNSPKFKDPLNPFINFRPNDYSKTCLC